LIKKVDLTNLLKVVHISQKHKIYEGLELSDEEDAQFADASGYTGIQHRKKLCLNPITMDEMVSLLSNQTQLYLVWKSIREIDKDNNGYVTNTELDDILKLYFPELLNKNLKKMFRQFESIQNRILIDYRTFKK
jgi:hypothetical protein